ncbi:MAG TPA: hypothetical protein VMU56_03050 [Beijerinckiaceae bacterium]|nr:hypothetical protein [Beijerinckiaceae bacterium]
MRQFATLTLILLCGFPAALHAQDIAPMPKPRPHDLAQPAPAPPPPAPQASDTSPVLTGTPVQRRAKIRVCGTQWDEMKRTGASVGTNWREFSRNCFARPLPPNAPP